ncbi:YwaF family protein [Spiroplasma chrysopicola]|uniref:Uncharacterized protein n=1 Tax=Spiroplasma chrysopicola DF-1 TaxID=1276227 RepID=R4UBS2_9MOLU|nr:YwaF family protein [Spiroplasma chrysopicola]AGM25369.1 hypothetical protein SCHRY_v1c07930 [Spiroplasma chrysopicola DF-1]
MITFAHIIAVIISFIVMASLFMFTKFYANKYVNISIRVTSIIWLLITQLYFIINRIIDNPHDINSYIYLELCNMVGWSAIIILIFPTKIQMDTFFPLAIIGPALTILIPKDWNSLVFSNFWYYQFYFGHLVGMYAYFYIYLYGQTKFKFSKQLISRSVLTGTLILSLVEVYNLTFGNNANYIFKDIVGAIGQDQWPQGWQFLFVLCVAGPVFLTVSWTVIYFFKPIYEINWKVRNQIKLRDTLWEKAFAKINFYKIR